MQLTTWLGLITYLCFLDNNLAIDKEIANATIAIAKLSPTNIFIMSNLGGTGSGKLENKKKEEKSK